MLRRDNIFHPRDRKKQYSKKKGKKKGIESPGDTDGPCATAKLRNSFSIRSRPRREKEDSVLHSVDEIHRSTGPDRSFFRPLFLYILSNSSPSRPLLFLFLSPFFSKPIQSGRKKGKDRIRGYLTIEREWEMKREREKRFYYSIIYFTRFIAAAADFASLYSTPAAASYQFAIPTIFALKNRDRARFCHQQFAHRTFKLILLSTCSPRLPCISPLLFFLFFFFF